VVRSVWRCLSVGWDERFLREFTKSLGEVEVRGLERVGVGIKVGDDLWVTDHHGLYA
jgi:hypothetical protein